LVHCTTEHGKRFVPVTTKVKAALPAVALVCDMETLAGAAGDEGEIVNGNIFESIPELVTWIFTVAAAARSGAGIVAMSCVELTKLVASGVVIGGVADVIQLTTEPFTKFEPFTVRVTPGGLHAGVMFDEVVEDNKEVIAGALIVKGSTGEAAAPGFIRSRLAFPGFARSAAGTVATSAAGAAGEVCAGT
jgi:hypothetical protein